MVDFATACTNLFRTILSLPATSEQHVQLCVAAQQAIEAATLAATEAARPPQPKVGLPEGFDADATISLIAEALDALAIAIDACIDSADKGACDRHQDGYHDGCGAEHAYHRFSWLVEEAAQQLGPMTEWLREEAQIHVLCSYVLPWAESDIESACDLATAVIAMDHNLGGAHGALCIVLVKLFTCRCEEHLNNEEYGAEHRMRAANRVIDSSVTADCVECTPQPSYTNGPTAKA